MQKYNQNKSITPIIKTYKNILKTIIQLIIIIIIKQNKINILPQNY